MEFHIFIKKPTEVVNKWGIPLIRNLPPRLERRARPVASRIPPAPCHGPGTDGHHDPGQRQAKGYDTPPPLLLKL